ncbi:hypothetical protein JNL27_09670 [bacterium]|nr:hypothetical protein [bacterium]
MNESLDPKHFDHGKLALSVLNANSILTARISTACKIENDRVAEIFAEVLKYLNLTAYYEQRLTPSLSIDYAWHEFILCTKAYTDFCQNHFGKYIHHHPGGTGKENKKQFMNTLKYYREHFGKPPDKFWGSLSEAQAACGACASSTSL